MNANAVVVSSEKAGEIMEAVIAKGDLGSLNPTERAKFYARVCESIGLNPLTKPFEYITLNGKLVLYARKDATDQLRKRYGVSVTDLIESERDGVFIVTAKVRDATGREDAAKGAVSIVNLKGEALANALMKAETKAKRRATLSICGLGFLDETEIETIPTATYSKANARDSYSELQAEIANYPGTHKDFLAWCHRNEPRINMQPPDWQKTLRLQMSEKLHAYVEKDASKSEDVPVVTDITADHNPVTGEVIWDEADAEPVVHPTVLAAEHFHKGWDALGPVKQAGILCNEGAFWRFLNETRGLSVQNPENAASIVRQHCLVASRSDIRNGHASGKLWRELVAEYRGWQREPAVIDPPQDAAQPLPAEEPAPVDTPTAGAGLTEIEQQIDAAFAKAAKLGMKALGAEVRGTHKAHVDRLRSRIEEIHKPTARYADKGMPE